MFFVDRCPLEHEGQSQRVTSRRLEHCQGRSRAKHCLSPLRIVGLVLAEKLMFVEHVTRGIRNLPLCLAISGIQCSIVVIVLAFQTSPQREAADTRPLQFVRGLFWLQPKTHVTCVGHAAATCNWRCRSRSACGPWRDVVRGWQYRHGLCFLVAPRSEKMANMGGERGAMWMMNERDEEIGHVCGSLPMALEAHCENFINFCNCDLMLCWCSFGGANAGVQRRARH